VLFTGNRRYKEFSVNRTFSSLALSIVLLIGIVGSAASQASKAKNPQTSDLSQVEAIIDEAVTRLWKQSDKHWHEGEYRHIVNIFRVITMARPDSMEAYTNAGWLLWSMNEDDEAVALYEQGLKANPDSYAMYDELGFYYFNRKRDYPRSISYYEKALTFKDCQPFALHMLAHAYEKTHQLDKALKTWERAAEMPDNAPARANLERIKRKMKQN
jgi:tetratricopeptide (TPR) repeat protein